MKCTNCPYSLDEVFLRYRKITITRLGEKNVVMEIVSDAEPDSKQVIRDTSVDACIGRIPMTK